MVDDSKLVKLGKALQQVKVDWQQYFRTKFLFEHFHAHLHLDRCYFQHSESSKALSAARLLHIIYHVIIITYYILSYYWHKFVIKTFKMQDLQQL